MAKEFRHIGKETPRLAARAFVTGRANYIRDIKRPNMLYGKVLRSPYAHANIKNVDTSKAEKLPGVKAVLTYKNVPNWMLGMPVPHVRLLDSKVRYIGDAVALVAGTTEEIAAEALDLIDVEYEPLPSVYDIEEATKPDAPQLYKEFPRNLVPSKPFEERLGQRAILWVNHGDPEKGFKEADIVVEGTARVENAQNALPPESPGVIAEWEDGKLTLWGSIQSVGASEIAMRAATGLPQGDLRLIPAYVGGSYGSKNNVSLPGLYAAALARATRRPVSLCYSKEEHFSSYKRRMMSRATYKVGMKRDGTVTAITGEWLANAGAASFEHGFMVSVGMIAFPTLTRCPSVRVGNRLVVTNTTPSGPYRGFGILENSAMLSMVLFMAMEEANLDPLEYYKKNCLKPGDQYFHAFMASGWEISKAPDVAKVIQKAAEEFGWKDKWKGWRKPTAVSGTRRLGVGVGMAGHPDVGEKASTAYVQLNAFGTVTVYCNASEFGTGARDVVRKMVAEALNMPLESISLSPMDTAGNPWEWGNTGSRGTYAQGTAVLAAAEDAKQKFFRRAAPMLGVGPEDLEMKDGWVCVRGQPEKTFPWIAVTGWDGSITGIGYFPSRYDLPTYQIHFVEAEVDIETGEVQLLDYVSAVDCGTIVNPLAFQGQLDGYVPGMDLCLREESVMDKNTGHVLNPNLIDYKWRLFTELPPHRNVILETIAEKADPACPFGARGGGEQSLAPAGPAVLMAVSNAVGTAFFEYPITPDKILKAMGKI